jgi:hypothetical protein
MVTEINRRKGQPWSDHLDINKMSVWLTRINYEPVRHAKRGFSSIASLLICMVCIVVTLIGTPAIAADDKFMVVLRSRNIRIEYRPQDPSGNLLPPIVTNFACQ